MSVGVETLPPPSGTGSVVLDIGGEIGAAAVYVPQSLADLEIEIRAASDQWSGTHVAVRERLLPDRTVWAALFPSLPQGDYEVRVREHGDAGASQSLVVTGGRVTTVHWAGG
jgi:hypothetical protein